MAQLEYRLPAGGNNGLLLRYPGTGDGAYEGLCEIQVLDDDHPKYAKLDPRQFNGKRLRHGRRPARLPPAGGEWNFQKVTAIGPKVTVELNGYLILDTDLSKVTEFMGGKPHPGLTRTKGHFGFAGHGDPVEFKGIFIRDLTKPAP